MSNDQGIEQVETADLKSADDLLEGIRHHLEGLWNTHYDNPEETQAITQVWQQVELLVKLVAQGDEMIAQLMHLTELMQQQRDLAFEDRDYWANAKRDEGKKALAWAIAWGSDVDEMDVMRVIDLLVGDVDLPVSEYSKSDLLEAFRKLAREAAEEAESPHPLAPSPTGEGEMDSDEDY